MQTDASPSARADLSNWRENPYSRWAFRNVRELITSVPVPNDPASVVALQLAAKPLSVAPLPRTVLGALGRATSTDGIVVLADGKIVYERYTNGNDAATPHIMMSATKAVVGLICGVLEDRGELDVEAAVERYVPEVGDTAYRGATLRHLLDMRAGVVLDEAAARAYEEATNWMPVPDGTPPGGFHAFFAGMPKGVSAVHGGPFSYVSANTDLLGWAIERATSTPVATLISEFLWKPLGSEQPAFLTVDRDGAPRCTGGLCATARDFARIGQLLVDRGRCGDRQVVPEHLIDDLFEGGDPAAWRDGQWGKSFGPISKNMRYRSGWYAIDDEPKRIFAMGVHGQNLFVDPARRIAIAKFSSWHEPTDYTKLPLTHFAVSALLKRVKAG